MARKVDIKKPKQAPVRSEDEVLFPHRDLIIQGEKLTVKELPLKLLAKSASYLDPLKQSFDAMPISTNDENFTNEILDWLISQWDNAAQLVVLSCDKSLEWFNALGNEEQDCLFMEWWNANNSFFIRRLLRRNIMKNVLARKSPRGG